MKALVFSVLSALILSACGGGGGGSAATGPSYTGLTTAVTIDSDATAQSIGSKTAEVTVQAIKQDTANDSNFLAPSATSITTVDIGMNQIITDIAHTAAQNLHSLPAGITYNAIDLDPAFCGGTITVDDAFINNFDQTNLLNGSMSFSNLCISGTEFGTLTMSGAITFTETATQLTIQYSNFTISDGIETQTINMTLTCDTTPTGGCSISSNYEGSDGNVYRIADVNVDLNFDGSYDFQAEFSHPEYGTVSITTTSSIRFDCLNGNPSEGSIQFTGADGSVSNITFNNLDDCNSYEGTWDYSNAVSPAPTAGVYSGSWL